MKRKKILLYVLAFMAFAGVFTGMCVAHRRNQERLADEMLATSATAAAQSLTESFRRQVSSISRLVQGVDAGEADDLAYLCAFAANIAAGEPAYSYYIMDERGALYDGGRPQGCTLGLTPVTRIAREGYCIDYVAHWADGEDAMITAVPVAEGSRYALVQIISMEHFSRMIIENIRFPVLYAGIYDQWQNLVAAPIPGDGTQDYAHQAQRMASDYAAVPGVYTLGPTELADTYGLCLSINEPPEWFLGLILSPRVLFPSLSRSDGILYAALGLGLLLFLLVLGLDIRSGRNKSQAAARHLDPLTGLLDAGSLQNAFEGYMKRLPMGGYRLVALDIKGFHQFNAIFSRQAGDKLLAAIGQAILQTYGLGARVGTDVFVFVVPAGDDLPHAIEGALLPRIEAALGAQVLPAVVFQFGVCPLEGETESFHDAYDGVMLALRMAKNNPKTHSVVYDASLREADQFARTVEINMLHALSHDEFQVYVQPKFRASDIHCGGGEALIRWASENMGLLMPGQFVPLFEQNGFIAEVDQYMLEAVLTYMQHLQDSGLTLYPIAVNQSRVTVSLPNYLKRIGNLAARFTVPLHYIELEITESAISEDRQLAPLIESLRQMGFSIAMDDFGSGYSSLNTLREIAVDTLKIDKGFLREADVSPKSRTIIRNIINMSKDLRISTVCEGVETKDQLAFLVDARCDVLQGYFLARPLPWGEFEERYLMAG